MAIPGYQTVFLQTEKMYKYWRCREVRELPMENIQRIWRGWALLGGYGDRSVRLGELSRG